VKKETQSCPNQNCLDTFSRHVCRASGHYRQGVSCPKKVTHEQAWKICLDELNKENVPVAIYAANERYVRIEGRMMRYGYRA
jgi:hypothetical protein